MRGLLLFVFIVLCTLNTSAQQIIKGRVVDADHKAVNNASISFRQVDGASIIGYATSGEEGRFELIITALQTDSISLSISHIGYERKTVTIVNQSKEYEFVLTPRSHQIEEISISNMPIFRRNDTLTYRVGAFLSEEDRVISDVIRRLPGIQIIEGRIEYMGQPIQRFTVNNMDVTEGRYGLISNNLRVDVVDEVQVVENDQPIKVLDSIVFSNRASLNLVVRRFKTTTTGKIGAGGKPVLWDLAITPITLSNNFQMLNTIQSNNVGSDSQSELTSHYSSMSSYYSTPSGISNPSSFLSIKGLRKPSLSEKKWLKNQLFMGSSNLLWKLPQDWEIKGNVSYYQDTQRENGSSSYQFFDVPGLDFINEAVSNTSKFHRLAIGMVLEKNEDKLYLKNNLYISRLWNQESGLLLDNDILYIDQNMSFKDIGLSNSLSTSFFVGRQLMNFSSHVEWHDTPHHLQVSPNPFGDLFSTENNLDESILQKVRHQNFQAANMLSLIHQVGQWRFTPGLKVDYQGNYLKSEISADPTDTSVTTAGDFKNDLRTDVIKPGIEGTIAYENDQWKLALKLPFTMSYFLRNKFSGEPQFNPNLGVTYLIDYKSTLSSTFSTGRSIEDITRQHPGFILYNYRFLQRASVRVKTNTFNHLRLAYNYMDAMKARSFHVHYAYEDRLADYTYQNTVDSMGRVSISVLDQNSQHASHRISASASQAFVRIKTNIHAGIGTGFSTRDHFLNGVKQRNNSNSMTSNIRINNNSLRLLSIQYQGKYQLQQINFSANNDRVISSQEHLLKLYFTLPKNNNLVIENELYTSSVAGSTSSYFLDLTYRYRLNRWKTDIDFSINNLLNNHTYVHQVSLDYQTTVSYYEMRPRQFIVSMNYSF